MYGCLIFYILCNLYTCISCIDVESKSFRSFFYSVISFSCSFPPAALLFVPPVSFILSPSSHTSLHPSFCLYVSEADLLDIDLIRVLVLVWYPLMSRQ